MSWNPLLDPSLPIGDAVDRIETVIVPRARDLGGFEVRRALPSTKRQMVGPFIFFDQIGPVEFLSGEGIDIRPHPHIGLATITYLFNGRLDFPIFIQTLAGLMIGAWFGAKWTHLAPLRLLRVFIVGMPAIGGLVMILCH